MFVSRSHYNGWTSASWGIVTDPLFILHLIWQLVRTSQTLKLYNSSETRNHKETERRPQREKKGKKRDTKGPQGDITRHQLHKQLQKKKYTNTHRHKIITLWDRTTMQQFFYRLKVFTLDEWIQLISDLLIKSSECLPRWRVRCESAVKMILCTVAWI